MKSKRNETFDNVIFWKDYDPGDLECKPGEHRGSHETGGAPTPWACPTLSWAPQGSTTDFFCLYKPTYPKNIEEEDRSRVLPQQASLATKNQSGPCSGTLPEGGNLTGGHLHHPGALHDEEGVVHPRG